jgi:hypothetical protein
MPNGSVRSVESASPRLSKSTKQLLQAAALGLALIPLRAAPVESAIISCVTSEADSIGCNGVNGSYQANNTEQTNVWKFYQSATPNPPEAEEDYTFNNLLYTFEVTGTPVTDFSLFVSDEWVGVGSENYSIAFPNSTCIPLLDDQDNNCVIFNVSSIYPTEADWEDTYYVEIRWFADPLVDPGDALNKPPDDGRNHIFRSPSGSNTFTDVLVTELYAPEVLADPADPALGGRGDAFSSFIAGRADVAQAPEPATMLLLGTGLAAVGYRRRRRR